MNALAYNLQHIFPLNRELHEVSLTCWCGAEINSGITFTKIGDQIGWQLHDEWLVIHK